MGVAGKVDDLYRYNFSGQASNRGSGYSTVEAKHVAEVQEPSPSSSGHSVDTDTDGSSKQRKQNRQPRNILVCPEMKLLAISLTGGNDS